MAQWIHSDWDDDVAGLLETPTKQAEPGSVLQGAGRQAKRVSKGIGTLVTIYPFLPLFYPEPVLMLWH